MRGSPQAGGTRGKSSDPHPYPPPGLELGAELETPRGAPGSPTLSPGPRFSRWDRRAAGRARTGGGWTRGSSARSREGSLRGGPPQGLPSAPATHSPCRVRKSRPESMPDARRRGEGSAAGAGRCGAHAAGGLGSEPSAEQTRRDCGGRRPEVGPGRRPAPVSRPCPRPSGPPTRVSPRPSRGPGGRAEVGAREPAEPWPPAGGRAPARNSQRPPASSAAATRGGRPCHYRGRPGPTPCPRAPPGARGDAPGDLASPSGRAASCPRPGVQPPAPQVCSPLRKTGAPAPRSSERTPGPGPEEGPLPPAGSVNPRSAFGGGCVGRGGWSSQAPFFGCPRPPPTPPTPLPPPKRLSGQGAPMWTPDSHLQFLNPDTLFTGFLENPLPTALWEGPLGEPPEGLPG